MKTQLYFWKPRIESMQNIYDSVLDAYEIKKLSEEDIQKKSKEITEKIWQNYPSDEYTDPANCAEYANEYGLDFALALYHMEENYLLLTASMVYQIWEQQIVKFTQDEMEHFFSFDIDMLDYEQAKTIFAVHDVDIDNTKAWKKLRELKFLTNTIKHGEGPSAVKLRKLKPKFFKNQYINGYDTLKANKSVLLERSSVNIQENDLYEYIDAANFFWDEMPERAFSDTKRVFDALKKLDDKRKKK